MADTQFRNNAIRKLIHDATTVHDLIPMLHLIELATLQNLLKQKVQQMDVSESSHVFCSAVSIENILPMDIIRHIASFHNMSRIASVSKTFNQCYLQNQKKEIQNRETYIASKIRITGHPITTFIVDPSRTKLSENEMKLQYKGPMNDLADAIAVANDGDRILLYEGTYGSRDKDIMNGKTVTQQSYWILIKT
eukprot:537224_1